MSSEPSDTDKAYAAGFIDGEGYVHLMRNNNGQYYARISVGQHDPFPLRWLCKTWGGGLYQYGEKVTYWKLQKQTDVIRFLKDIQPYLRVKDDQVNYILNCEGIYIKEDAVAIKAMKKTYRSVHANE